MIRVVTRRGRAGSEGKLQVSLRNEAGPSFTAARFERSNAHPFQITGGAGGQIDFIRAPNGDRVLEADHIADNAYPNYFDHQSQLYRSGLFLANHLSVDWRKGSTNLAASFDNSRDEGTVFALSGFRRRNLRLNVDQRLGPLEFGLSGFYGWSDRHLSPGNVTPFFAVRFLEPHVDLLAPNPDGSPYRAEIPDRLANASNPLYALANQRQTSEGERLMGGATMKWQPVLWLAIDGSHHVERADLDSTFMFAAGYLTSSGTPVSPGFVRNRFFSGRSHHTEAAIATTLGWNRIRNATRIGYVYETRTVNDSVVAGAPGTDPQQIETFHANTSVKSVYATTSFILNDRYAFDAAARRDDMSFLAPEVRAQWYYRAGAAWRANMDLRIQAFDELGVHAAYGSAGQRPGFSGGFGAPIAAGAALRAPRTGELELGTSLVTRGGRFTLDYAYSRKTTKDVIDVAGIPTPVGFVEMLVNAGTVRTVSHEITLGYTVLRTPDLGWDLRLTGDRVRAQITEYSLPERVLSSGFQDPAIILIGSGRALGVMHGMRFVRDIAELYDDPEKEALSGPGQAFDPANFVVNEEGYVVSKSSWHCGEDQLYRDGRGACSTPERPILYRKVTCPPGGTCQVTEFVPIGDTAPDLSVGLQSSFRHKRFGFSALFDWSQGGDVYNASRQWSFLEQRDPIFDQRGKPEVEKKSFEYYGAFRSGINSQALFVESATYLKVRELAVTYEFRLGGIDRVRVGLVGRNLFTLSGYSGLDPEVGNAIDPFLVRSDLFQYPRYRTVSGLVEIAF